MTHVLNVLLFLFFSVVEVFSECRLLSYMAQVENRLFYLYRLISIINVQTLTQASYKIYIFLQPTARVPILTWGGVIFIENIMFQQVC